MNIHQAHIPDSKSLLARDRVLLYTRGMDIAPEDGVALALESLRRAGHGVGPDVVMEELFGLLREHGALPALENGETPLISAPPINRRILLPKDMDPLSLTAAVARRCRKILRRLVQKDTA